MFYKHFQIILLSLILVIAGCEKTQESSETNNSIVTESEKKPQELVIYSSRNEQLILPLIEAYQQNGR